MWLEDDMLYADIVLPINTLVEEDDIGTDNATFMKTFYSKKKCIESIGESKSDYDAVGEVAKKLGV
jgi:trimethylamine-N-oxide reductase (cytochrome c)